VGQTLQRGEVQRGEVQAAVVACTDTATGTATLTSLR
jgi:hypothetical protein